MSIPSQEFSKYCGDESGAAASFTEGNCGGSEARDVSDQSKSKIGDKDAFAFCKLRGAASHKHKKSTDRRISLTYMEKAEIVRYKRRNDKLTYEELGCWCEERYGKRPSNAALCKLISKEAEQVLKYVENEGSRYNKHKAKLQKSPVDKVEQLLGVWFKDSSSAEHQPPTDSSLVERAKLIGAELGVLETQNFKYSPSWLLRFKKRFGIIDGARPAGPSRGDRYLRFVGGRAGAQMSPGGGDCPPPGAVSAAGTAAGALAGAAGGAAG